eukprot:c2493_g1_i1.p1 GENE.c2493_g1_i1~~c2493_g1_i1.p1  ORF type:complete len:1107 (+),score=261.38 c2493_g1_i1:32-3352(+)
MLLWLLGLCFLRPTTQHRAGEIEILQTRASLAATSFKSPPNAFGFISSEIGLLLALEDLHISASSQIMGPLPREIGLCTSLTSITAHHTSLSGPLPPEIGKLSHLRYLDFDHTRITSPLPLELSLLTNLQVLRLGSTELVGPVPLFLSQMPNLKTVILPFATLPTSLALSTHDPDSTNSPPISRKQFEARSLPAPLELSFTNDANLLHGVLDSNLSSCIELDAVGEQFSNISIRFSVQAGSPRTTTTIRTIPCHRRARTAADGSPQPVCCADLVLVDFAVNSSAVWAVTAIGVDSSHTFRESPPLLVPVEEWSTPEVCAGFHAITPDVDPRRGRVRLILEIDHPATPFPSVTTYSVYARSQDTNQLRLISVRNINPLGSSSTTSACRIALDLTATLRPFESLVVLARNPSFEADISQALIINTVLDFVGFSENIQQLLTAATAGAFAIAVVLAIALNVVDDSRQVVEWARIDPLLLLTNFQLIVVLGQLQIEAMPSGLRQVSAALRWSMGDLSVLGQTDADDQSVHQSTDARSPFSNRVRILVLGNTPLSMFREQILTVGIVIAVLGALLWVQWRYYRWNILTRIPRVRAQVVLQQQAFLVALVASHYALSVTALLVVWLQHNNYTELYSSAALASTLVIGVPLFALYQSLRVSRVVRHLSHLDLREMIRDNQRVQHARLLYAPLLGQARGMFGDAYYPFLCFRRSLLAVTLVLGLDFPETQAYILFGALIASFVFVGLFPPFTGGRLCLNAILEVLFQTGCTVIVGLVLFMPPSNGFAVAIAIGMIIIALVSPILGVFCFFTKSNLEASDRVPSTWLGGVIAAVRKPQQMPDTRASDEAVGHHQRMQAFFQECLNDRWQPLPMDDRESGVSDYNSDLAQPIPHWQPNQAWAASSSAPSSAHSKARGLDAYSESPRAPDSPGFDPIVPVLVRSRASEVEEDRLPVEMDSGGDNVSRYASLDLPPALQARRSRSSSDRNSNGSSFHELPPALRTSVRVDLAVELPPALRFPLHRSLSPAIAPQQSPQPTNSDGIRQSLRSSEEVQMPGDAEGLDPFILARKHSILRMQMKRQMSERRRKREMTDHEVSSNDEDEGITLHAARNEERL